MGNNEKKRKRQIKESLQIDAPLRFYLDVPLKGFEIRTLWF